MCILKLLAGPNEFQKLRLFEDKIVTIGEKTDSCLAVQTKGNLKLIHFELRFVILDCPVSQCILEIWVTGSNHLGSYSFSLALSVSHSLWLSLHLFLFLNI